MWGGRGPLLFAPKMGDPVTPNRAFFPAGHSEFFSMGTWPKLSSPWDFCLSKETSIKMRKVQTQEAITILLISHQTYEYRAAFLNQAYLRGFCFYFKHTPGVLQIKRISISRRFWHISVNEQQFYRNTRFLWAIELCVYILYRSPKMSI